MENKDLVTPSTFSMGNQHVKHKQLSTKISTVMKKIRLAKERKPSKSELIIKMTKSNTMLRKDIKQIKSVGNCIKDVTQVNTIVGLIQEMDGVELELKSEKEYLADLLNKNQESTTDILKLQKQKTKTDTNWLSDIPQDSSDLDRYKNALQEKLHAANVQLSNEITKNAELRGKIQVLMQDRTAFNKDYDRLLNKLKIGKEVLTDLKDTIGSTHKLKQHFEKKLEKLNIKEKKQRTIQEEEAVELEERKSFEISLRLFFDKKLQTREITQAGKHGRKQNLIDHRLKEKLQKNLMTVNKCITDIFGIEFDEQDTSFELVPKKIKLGDSDIETLIAYLAQLNHEREALKEKVFNQEMELKEQMSIRDEKEDQEESRVELLKMIKNDCIDTCLALTEELNAAKRTLDKLLSDIQNLTEITKTDLSPLLTLLGETNNVNGFNYKLFLELIENKIISLMQKVHVKKVPAISVSRSVLESSYALPGTEAPVLPFTRQCPICHQHLRKLNALM